MKKIFFFSFLILCLNLGNLIDLTKEPEQADIIVVLGGGGFSRIEEGTNLYKKHYSNLDNIIIFGNEKWYKKAVREKIIKNKVEVEDIIYIDKVLNTMEELIALKKYIIDNNLKDILIVSHPTHSLRIELMANILLNYKKENINLTFISADHTKVWDKQLYFLEIESIKLVFLELIKIIYNFTRYSNFLFNNLK